MNWPKRPPLAFSVVKTSVAEMSGPKRPRPKCPWPKCPTFIMRGAKQIELFEISDLRRRLRSVCPPVCVCVWGGGGGYSDIFIHTYTLAIFGGSKF